VATVTASTFRIFLWQFADSNVNGQKQDIGRAYVFHDAQNTGQKAAQPEHEDSA
jgi:hypothetical protein